jgi:hypothetical protein
MKWLLAIVFMFSGACSSSQTLEDIMARQLEVINEREEDEVDETLEEEYASLIRHPLDINRCDETEWSVFPFITSLQIKSLARYRQMFGDLLSVYELQAVPFWNVQELEKILPYITVTPDDGILNWKGLWKGESMMLLRNKMVLEKRKGFIQKENGYTGSPLHLFFNYRYRYRKLLDLGFRLEKDPGETMFGREIKTFDFISFHLYKQGSGIIRRIALGDFTVNYGQGLIHWQSRSFGKGSSAVKKEGAPILPYTSANENNFHRGIGIALAKGKMQGSLFFASQKQSSVIQADSLGEYFSGINTSGLHRTKAELSQRKKPGYTSAGFSLHFASEICKIGFNLVHHHFSTRLDPASYTYNMYDLRGKTFFNGSLDYELTIKNIHFFGEAALDQQRSPALVAGVLAAADRNLDLSFVFRSIARDYRALGANAFTESGAVENEKGIYAGLAFRPSEAWRVEGYADFFRFPWLRYRVDRPSPGSDYLLSITFKPSKLWEFYTRLRSKQKEINTDADHTLHETASDWRKSLKLYLRNSLSMNTSIKLTAESIWYQERGKAKEEGFLGYFELAFRPIRKISTNFRTAYFETSGFNSRVYAYESGLPYNSETPFLDGQGFRYYLNTKVIIKESLNLAFRFSQTIYSDKMVIGSGLEEISGSHLTKLEMQFQHAF